MSELDYAEVARTILKERPEGYTVPCIRVNFDKIDHDIAPRLQERSCGVFQDKAANYLNADIEVTPDSSISELWTYELVHECGRSPHYDEENEEYYCPICADSVFDF